MSQSQDDFMRQASARRKAEKTKDDERFRRLCTSDKTAKDMSALMGWGVDKVRETAKRLGLALAKEVR